MVSYVLMGNVDIDKKDILDMLDKYPFVNIDFRNALLADYMKVGSLIDLFSAIRDKVGVDMFFKKVAWINVPEEVKTTISIALEEIL